MYYSKFLNTALIILFITYGAIAENVVELGKTYINLSVTETIEVPQDLLTARLIYEAEDVSAKLAQDKVNRMMSQIKDLIKATKDIEFFTDNYYVYQQYLSSNDCKKTKPVYKASQSIIIKGMNVTPVLELAGNLQNMGLLLQGLNYSLSDQKVEELKNTLIVNAINKLRARSSFLTTNLGKSNFRFVEININDSNYTPPIAIMPRKAMLSTNAATDSFTAPIAQGSNTKINITFSAKIEVE